MQGRTGALDPPQLLVDALTGGVDRFPDRAQLIEGGPAAMLLQPQALAQHFLHGLADGVAGAAGGGLDFGPGRPEAGFQLVGGVQELAHRTPAGAGAAAQPECGGESGQGGGGDQDEDRRQGGLQRADRQSAVPPDGGQIPPPRQGVAAPAGLTAGGGASNILRLMSAEVPEMLDAWRMVAARRGFEGRQPLSSLPRLREALFDDEGEVTFALDFDRDALQVPYVELRIEAALPLQCQRTLQRFLLPVRVVQRLGLLRAGKDSDEAALPPGYEALLVAEDGMLHPLELVEDELILAVPLVPVKPGSETVERDWPVQADEETRANPFSALAALKKNH